MNSDHVNRVTYVIRVLAKQGLAGALSKYGFSFYLPILKRGAKDVPADLPQRLRKSMEELGGAYIKLGQLLSVRPDLIPQEYCDEFSKLQDDVPPERLNDIERVISEDFKAPANKLFTHIDAKPLGSASVAQVHKARLKAGTAVAVKIQRPDVAKKFSADIDIIRYLAQKLHRRITGVNPLLIVDEFERYTKKELDFTVEASHLDEIREALTNKQVIVPRVYWTNTSKRVLTMEYLDGTKLSEIKQTDKPHAARVLLDAFIEQVFQRGIFHADLHPGNVLLLKNGKLGLIDFGIVGHLDNKTRQLGLKLYLAILDKDTRHIAETLLQYGSPTSKTNVQNFVNAVNELFNTWWEANPEKRRVTHLMHNLFILCGKHNIKLPGDTILLGKGMMTVESTARVLDPKFDFVTYSQPKITALLKQQRSPKKMLNNFAKRSRLFAEALSELPSRALETVNALKHEGIAINLKDTQFRHLGQDINLSSNRLSYAMISAALIMAASLMIDVGPKYGTYSVISLLSLFFAAIFVLILFVSITHEHTAKYDPHEEV